MKNKRASKGSTGTKPTRRSINTKPATQVAIFYTATPNPVLRRGLFFYFFIIKWFSMSVSYFVGRRRRPWVSHIIVGCYGDMLVYAVYRTPVVRGVPMLHLSWLHKIVPAS